MMECAVDELDLVLFEYITRGNPKSNEQLKRYLKRYPRYREEIIEFTANWRAFSILDRMLPPPPSIRRVTVSFCGAPRPSRAGSCGGGLGHGKREEPAMKFLAFPEDVLQRLGQF